MKPKTFTRVTHSENSKLTAEINNNVVEALSDIQSDEKPDLIKYVEDLFLYLGSNSDNIDEDILKDLFFKTAEVMRVNKYYVATTKRFRRWRIIKTK